MHKPVKFNLKHIRKKHLNKIKQLIQAKKIHEKKTQKEDDWKVDKRKILGFIDKSNFSQARVKSSKSVFTTQIYTEFIKISHF